MAFLGRNHLYSWTQALCCAGVLMALAPQPASAGFLDRLFGGFRRAIEAPSRPPAEAPPYYGDQARQEQLRGATATGPARAFCVRSCDGRYFPVQAHAGMSAADACHSFCPASETKLFGGSNIDTATAPDGSRYTDLKNAYAYRKAFVTGCTCNGRDGFGLAHIDPKTDPTLRPGDIVATGNGLAAYNGPRSSSEFTPVQNYSRLPQATRERLAETKVAPREPQAFRDIAAQIPRAAAEARAEAQRD
jgi:hypothetical protein